MPAPQGGPVVLSTGFLRTPSGSFQRPANATAYASGQLIANSITVALCVPVTLSGAARLSGGSGMVRRVWFMSSNGLAWVTSAVRVHLFTSAPVYTNGDGGNVNGGLTETNAPSYLGWCDIANLTPRFSGGVKCMGSPAQGTEMNFQCADGSTSLYAVCEARGAINPAASDIITVGAEIWPD